MRGASILTTSDVLAPRIVFDVHAEKEAVNAKYMNFYKKKLNLRFGEVLARVSLPRWPSGPQAPAIYEGGEIVTSTEEILNQKAEGKGMDGWGPYKEVFKWLRDEHVEEIDQVQVDDSGEFPHSDAIIIQCLQNFKVRVLDWSKFNLGSSVIKAATPEVEVLKLRSSGREAALIGWSCKDGLCKLPKVSPVSNPQP